METTIPGFNAVRGRGGYSLTELMLVVGITGVLAAVGPLMMIQVTRFFRQNEARSAIQRDARAIFDLMGRNLRQAQASTIVIDQMTGQPPYSRVQFTKADGKQVTYYQQGDHLFQVAGGTKSLLENLRYVAFTNPRTDNDNLMSVTITLEQATYDAQTKALQLSVEKIRVYND